MLRTLMLCSFCLILFSAFWPANSLVLAQSSSTTGSITGTVRDLQGAVIVEATITATQLETNLTRNVQSEENGTYYLAQLPPGNYRLSVQADGFAPATKTFPLTIGVTALIEFKLLVAGTSEVIEVTGSNLLTEGRTESSTTVDRQRIDNLPINRRDFLDFALTTPRVAPDRVSNQGILATSELSFNGQSGRFNNITIDGLDNNDISQGAVRSTFGQEAVQEFQVVSDSYSAEFGRALAGVINIVTRVGSNDLHGNLFFLNRNDKISARDTFAAFRPRYSQYQSGAVLGGPIKRDKAFFFTSFERLSIKQNNIVTISNESINSAQRLGYAINNGPIPFAIGTTSLLARADLHLTTKDSLSLRYNGGFNYNGAFEPFGGLLSETNSGLQRLNDNSIAVSNTLISLGLNLINETRFLYGRRNQRTVELNDNAAVRLLAPEGSIQFGHSSFLPEFNEQRIYQIVNNVTLSRARQQIKFGVDFTYIDRPGRNQSVSLFAGGFGIFGPIDFSALSGMPNLPSFTGLEAFDARLRTPVQRSFLTVLATVLPSMVPGFPANVPLADLALPLAYLQGFGDTRFSVTTRLFSLFLQDDIKVRPNLLIKAGLRYDINRAKFTPDNNGNFSPRLALSYRPTALPKLNLHAAYGLFFGTPFIRSTVSAAASSRGLNLLFLPFPVSVLPFALPGHKFPESDRLPTGVSLVPQLNIFTQYQPDLRNSYTQQISVGCDYLLGNNTTILLSYNYVRGIKLQSLRNINVVVRPLPGDAVGSLISGRVDPSRGDVFEFESAFDSYYHGLTISINRRFSNHFGLLANYVYSKSIDNVADFSVQVTDRFANMLNPALERGLSGQDARNRFTLSGNWELSYIKNPLLGNLYLSAIVNLRSGLPYNLLAGVDVNLDGDPSSDRPTALGRNAGITPGFASFDLRLTRIMTIREKYQLQGFVEVFNLLNRVNISPNDIDRTFPPDAQGNFQLPSQQDGRYIITPDRYRGAFPPRQFQLGVRLTF
ncbi:MAG: TonB-dependent receptor [Acidobacteriota bacterium]